MGISIKPTNFSGSTESWVNEAYYMQKKLRFLWKIEEFKAFQILQVLFSLLSWWGFKTFSCYLSVKFGTSSDIFIRVLCSCLIIVMQRDKKLKID